MNSSVVPSMLLDDFTCTHQCFASAGVLQPLSGYTAISYTILAFRTRTALSTMECEHAAAGFIYKVSTVSYLD